MSGVSDLRGLAFRDWFVRGLECRDRFRRLPKLAEFASCAREAMIQESNMRESALIPYTHMLIVRICDGALSWLSGISSQNRTCTACILLELRTVLF